MDPCLTPADNRMEREKAEPQQTTVSILEYQFKKIQTKILGIFLSINLLKR